MLTCLNYAEGSDSCRSRCLRHLHFLIFASDDSICNPRPSRGQRLSSRLFSSLLRNGERICVTTEFFWKWPLLPVLLQSHPLFYGSCQSFLNLMYPHTCFSFNLRNYWICYKYPNYFYCKFYCSDYQVNMLSTLFCIGTILKRHQLYLLSGR